ncbi:SIS domain-containing protein [Vibrio sp. DW001]|uniref:SIS domain-containing protein n=1 Tax=Vibrio sp. DW001 TaxID=2912315 RepID=UPI0023AF2491|nr:SIS domain-containing protein [Vibrio sp. DW001]WED29305.1 SIS domain-containing protein [Vibrio sp. DW001]
MSNYLGYDESWLIENKGIHTAREIQQQPALWRQLIGSLFEKRVEIDAFMASILSKKELRIILTGAGTSAFAGEAIAPYLQQFNDFNVKAIASTDIVSNPSLYLDRNKPTLLVSFARSGNSPESVAAVELADQLVPDCHHLFLTCNAEGELSKYAKKHENSLCVLMPELSNDQSFAMTSSFTCMTMSALAILGEKNLEVTANSVEKIASVCEKRIPEWTNLVSNLAKKDYKRLVVLGSGGFVGLAREASLKSLELSAGKVMTAYDSSLGFRHGPKFTINSEMLVIQFLSSHPYTRKYDIDLYDEISSDDQVLGLVALSEESFTGLNTVELGHTGLEEVWLSFPYIIFAQMLAFEKSLQLGLGPDNPCPTGEVNRVVEGVNIHSYKNNNC